MENEKLNKEGKATIELMVADGIISRECAEKYFPELKENEDERIRKALIDFFDKDVFDCGDKSEWVNGIKYKDVVAWLEKQGEQKANVVVRRFLIGDTFIEKYNPTSVFTVTEYIENGIAYVDQSGERFTKYYDDSWDDYQLIEQNPAEKVEPKSKVGDWVCHTVYKKPLLIVEDLGEGDFRTEPKSIITAKEFREGFYRLWTIQDAKDGDILVHSSFMFGDFIFIYNNTSILQAYCYYSSERDRFIIEDKEHPCPWNMQEVKPATKEQRDILFQKMKEAGYEWDADKKELKKIEPTLAWSEEDEKQARQIERIVHNGGGTQKLQKKIADWLKSIKDRVQPQPKREWSKEDNDMMRNIIDDIYCGTNFNPEVRHAANERAKWFKSICLKYQSR